VTPSAWPTRKLTESRPGQASGLESAGGQAQKRPRLRDRLGDVAVLPSACRQTWLRRAAASEQRFRRQHGGLDEAETSTYLAQLTK